jgi:hypothetical protein
MRDHYKRLTKILGIIFLSFFLFTSIIWIQGKYILSKSKDSFENGLAKDISYRRDKGDIVAKQEDIKVNLLKNDSYNILSILVQKKDEYHIGLLAVANDKGILTVRTVSNVGRGVNVFLATPQGRALSNGSSTASIEKSIFDPQQVFIVTARPILDGKNMIGALFASENLDDVFAKGFKEHYLSYGVELAFYSKDVGLYSSTFKNDAEKNLLRLYFNSNSDWVKGNHSGDTVRLANGRYYQIINIPLEGLEGTTGGALIFVPEYPYLTEINLVLLVFLIIFYIVKRYLRRPIKQRKTIKILLYTLSVVVLFIFITILILQINLAKIPSLKNPPFTIYNSTLRFQPDSGILSTGFDQTVGILIDTGGESINTVGVSIHFNPDLVSINKIDTSDSFCSYFIEKRIDVVNGIVTVSCLIPSPGLFSSSAVIANLIVTPKKSGSFDLTYFPETRVLANDGLGTDILRTFSNASFKIESSSITTSPLFLNVYSASNPNDTKWYNTNFASFNWQAIPSEKYRYIFDTSSTTLVSESNSTLISKNNISLPVPRDGIFYFHVAVQNEGATGPTSVYKIQADMTPPQNVLIKASATTIHTGDTVRFEFSGSDATSGILPNYYVKINTGGLLLPVKKELYVPLTTIGDNTVTLRLFDRAGNFTERSLTIKVLR